MNITLETYNDKLIMLMPLTDNVYGSASRVAMTIAHSDLDRAISYYKVMKITVDVFDNCPDVEAKIAHLIVARRNGYTWKAI